MKNSKLAQLAIAGLVSGSAVVTAAPLADNIVVTSKNAKDEIAHKCAGLNSCKGLGGCKVSASKLKKLAKKAGVAAKDAGDSHKCAGLNSCKGLGGCKITKGKLAELKKKAAMK